MRFRKLELLRGILIGVDRDLVGLGQPEEVIRLHTDDLRFRRRADDRGGNRGSIVYAPKMQRAAGKEGQGDALEPRYAMARRNRVSLLRRRGGAHLPDHLIADVLRN